MSGYIKIDRNITEWEWYKNINTKTVFLHMLLKANWKDGKFEGHVVPRGSFVSSRQQIALDTTLTENEVRTAILHLEKTGEITKKSTNKFTIYTVCNYCKYQDLRDGEPPTINQQTTNKSPTINQLLTTIEEGKKERREEDIVIESKDSIRQTETVRHIIEEWNSLSMHGIPEVTKVSPSSKRYKNLVARIKEYGEDNIVKAIYEIPHSPFLLGKNKSGWNITFDWFVLPSNFPKVLDGNYRDNVTTFTKPMTQAEQFLQIAREGI